MSVYGRMSDGQIRRLSGYKSLKSSEKHLLTRNLAEQLPSPKLHVVSKCQACAFVPCGAFVL